jgi:hypothetical protein
VPCCSFPYAVFEAAILSCLREVDPAEIIESQADQTDERDALKTELERISTQVEEAKANILAGGSVVAGFDVLRQLEVKQREAEAQFREANEKAARPLEATWDEAKTLVDALASAPAPEAARLRLRAALRRIVDSVWVLIVPRGRVRLAAVQIDFAEGSRRNYLVWHRPPSGNHLGRQPGYWQVLSYKLTKKPATSNVPQHTWVEMVDGAPERGPDYWKNTEWYLTEMSAEDLDRMFGGFEKHELP